MNETQKIIFIINSAASLQEAAEQLRMTPTAVSSRAARLRKAGYDVQKFTATTGGARNGAGRPARRFTFDDAVVIERGLVNDLPSPPEAWQVAAVGVGYFELQREVGGVSEIITITNTSTWNGGE